MTHSCPLPVDWLDYLEGDGEPQLTAHLADCPSCRALVASLIEGSGLASPQEGSETASDNTDWFTAFFGAMDAVWQEDRPERPAPAQFWFSASDFELDDVVFGAPGSGKSGSLTYHGVDRMLLLVVSHPDDDHAHGWLDVVPVLSDVEQASETDLLFSAEENSLGAPWRALFAYQCKVARQQLDTRVGVLSTVGAQTLRAALAGEADDSRWGVPLQHPDDPRGRFDDEFEEALRRLRSPWLELRGAGVVEGQDDDSNPGIHLVAGDESSLSEVQDEPVSQHVFWLTPVAEPVHEFALAAASSAATHKKDFWVLDDNDIKLAGKLDVDWQKGLLMFLISATSLAQAARVRLHVLAAGKRYASEPFAAVKDAKIPLTEGLTKEAVERLGAEVLS